MRKWNLKWLWVLFIFVAGCAVAPVQRIDLSGINFGCSMEEVKKEVPGVPEIKTISFGEVLAEIYMFGHPEADIERVKKEFGEVKWTLLLYQGGHNPLWFIFDEKNNLMFSGEGGEETANYAMYVNVVGAFETSKLLTHVKAETLKYDKFRKVMKEKNYISYFEELWKYRIMLAERVDKKEITEKEFDYLTTQKQNEIQSRAAKGIRDKYRADNRGGLTPSQALIMGMFLSRPQYPSYRSPYIYTPGGFLLYNPYPY